MTNLQCLRHGKAKERKEVVMPRGKNKGGVNCRTCIDCEPMVAPEGDSYRCYGEVPPGVPIKKDFSRGQANPPAKAPDWCPHRLNLRKEEEVKRRRKSCYMPARKGE